MPRPISLLAMLLVPVMAACDKKTDETLFEDYDVAPALAPIPVSRFNVPLDYDFTPILRTVERVVPRTFGHIDSIHSVGNDDRKRYSYEAHRGSFTAWAKDSLVYLRATLTYAARGYYDPPIGPTVSAGCGKNEEQSERPRIIVELVTPLTLTENWHLKSKAKLVRLEPASDEDRDRCKVTIIQYDVTERVIETAQKALTQYLPQIDKKIAEVDLTKRFEHWWELLNRPIRLTDSVWLTLGPERLRMGKVSGAKHIITVATGLDAYPRIITGPQPESTYDSLPPLARDTVAGGFYIALEGVIDYETASRTITQALHGREITQAGQTVRVDSVLVRPAAGGRLLLLAAFQGDVDGTLRFVGKPSYDRVNNTVAVPDLDYDLDTDSKLVNTSTWLLSGPLLNLFREKAQVSVEPALARGKELLNAGLNRKVGSAMTLSATIDSVAARNIYVTRTGLTVRGEAMGNAGVSVRQK